MLPIGSTIVAEKHGGKSEAENLANCCSLCNQRKGSDLSSIDHETGEIVPLFHPRRDQWLEHFRVSAGSGSIEPLTSVGRVTVSLLRLNAPDRIEERAQLLATGLLVLPAN